MPLPLLQTKLYVPPPHATLVNRPRLLARWQAAMLPPLTLISAPAGFGKTTLISEWIGAVGQAAAGQTNDRQATNRQLTFCWLSLDQEDNDPIRFLTYLIGALQSCQPTIGEGALGLLAAPQPPPLQAVLTQLINELSQLPATICLVLDDYHFINTPAIHEALNFLIDHLPATLRVIMTTRSDPPLHLSRWRVRRQLLELHADDLRFTAAEAAIFLNQLMGLQLSPAAVELLESRTEGWIAGLQLAALSMQGRGDLTGFLASFSGSHRFIFDYLVDEVLAGQPAGIENFLLQTSILERFCAPLCDAVTAQTDARLLLAQLERANLFLIPLDHERQWYRYHHLFADVLRVRLLDQMAEAVPLLHQRASQWYAEHESPIEAVTHGFAGATWDNLALLIEQVMDTLFDRGERTLLQGWLVRLPKTLLHTRPRLLLAQAWLSYHDHQIDAVEESLLVAEAALSTQPTGADDLALRAEISAARAAVALFRRDLPTAIALAQQTLLNLPASKARLRAQTTLRLGLAHNWSGELAQANDCYGEAARVGQAAGDIHTAVLATTNQAGILYERGRLRQAAALEQQAIAVATTMGAPKIPIVGTVKQALALYYYEWNQLDTASHLLHEAIERIQPTGNPRLLVETYSTLIRVFTAQQDEGKAFEYLQRAEQLVHEYTLPIRYAAPVVELRVLWWLAHNQVDEASKWASNSGLGSEDLLNVGQEHSYCTLARVLIAQGDYGRALPLLERLQQLAASLGRRINETQACALRIVALARHGDQVTAQQLLLNLLPVTEPEGYIRTFVDEGEPMRRLIADTPLTITDPTLLTYTTHLLAAFPDTPLTYSSPQPAIPFPIQPESIQNPKSKIQNLVEPLTAREIEVLHLVAEGLSDRQIAAQLVVALGTVKRHLNNLYGKLGVQRRTQAILRAKEAGLL